MTTYSKEILKSLIEGTLPWATTKSIMSGNKDEDRFEKYLEILQEKVPWKETIVVPLGEHLYVVKKVVDGKKHFIVKCDCGHEFCDYRQNWKMEALIYARDTEEKLDEIYPGDRKPDPNWSVIREYYCPGCNTQLEVEALPPGYPVIFDFLPDIEGFYNANPKLKKKILD